MKTYNTNQLKKLCIEDIKKIRQLRRDDWSREYIANKFNIATTTVDWHAGDIIPDNIITIE